MGPAAEGSDASPWWDVGPGDPEVPYRIRLQPQYGETHELVVTISPFMPYFGGDELTKLHQLADMVGLALERSEMAEQMAYQASHDALTGLVNRAAFVESLELALGHIGRRFNALAIMFIDLDRFKSVNDKADHTVGDVVLQEMSRRLAAGRDASTWWRGSAATSSWPSPRWTTRPRRWIWPSASGPCCPPPAGWRAKTSS